MTNIRRLWFVMANAAFLLGWFALCVLTVRHWRELPADSHFWNPVCAAAFLLLWFYMLKEKNSTLSIATAVVVLLASIKMAFP